MLEAFSVNNFWSHFVIFLHRNTHLRESRQSSEHSTSAPHGVLPVIRAYDPDPAGVTWIDERRYLFVKAFTQSR